MFKKKLIISFVFICSTIAIDQLLKFLARLFLSVHQPPINIIPGFIDLKLVYNTGISFGWFSHNHQFWGWLLLSILTVLVIAYISFYLLSRLAKFDYLTIICLSVIIGGAIGNGWDRLFFRQVTDFMLFRIGSTVLFVNNFADDVISIALLILLLQNFNKKKVSYAD